MKSPFPGMDPYIESCGLWGDFHHTLITELKVRLSAKVPERYVVRVDLRSYVSLVGQEGKEDSPFVPDVRVTDKAPAKTRRGKGRSVAVAEAKAELDDEAVDMQAFIAEEHREAFIEIYETDPERHLITSIEVLSPGNKRRNSEGWDRYLRKRQSLLLGAANLVEIDVLRGGQRFPMLTPWPTSPYTILVSRKRFAPRCKVWPGHFQRPLPTIPVPLAHPDPDIPIDLQSIVNDVYSHSRYDQDIDYRKPLDPPLDEQDAAWLFERLQSTHGP